MPALFVTSRLLPVRHGFSLRQGGVSDGPHASLNLGFSVEDSPSRVEENLRLLCDAAKLDPGELATTSQVHGDRVSKAGRSGRGGLRPPEGEADGLWTDEASVTVAVKTADCVPILLADRAGRRVSAVHSGWRGTALKIAARAVEVLVSQGARAQELVAAVGPAIGPCCYEVSDELGERFNARFGEAAQVVVHRGGRAHLDLPRAVRATLLEAGLQDENIDPLGLCTHCDAERFYSHRRDKGRTGRHLSFIQCGRLGPNS